MNLHAVEHDGVVLGAPSAHRERAFFVVGGRNAGIRRQHLEHVLERASGLEHLADLDFMDGRNPGEVAGAIDHVDLLFNPERVWCCIARRASGVGAGGRLSGGAAPGRG